VVLALGLIWTVLIRIPLILNAEDHLDSDLAVDGLTLLDAVNGHWRWHYPGTPHMGILPMLSSYPQALVWGASPITLVSGGTVLWVLVVASTFWLARRAFGPSVAAWAIVPLAFSSTGTMWLSGRITGGHLLTLAWHTLALTGLHLCLSRGGRRSAALLGAWCGLGLYLDAMFVLTLVGICSAAGLTWLKGSRSRSGLVSAVAFLVGMFVGLLPREIGRRVDPYDAYPAQFAATFQSRAIAEHAGLFGWECLPRLIAGSGIHAGWRSAGPFRPIPPSGSTAAGRFRNIPPSRWPAVVLLIGCAAAFLRLAFDIGGWGNPARFAVVHAALLSGLLIVLAFYVNKNIFNSDNYRYLIFLLTVWSLGLGLCLDDLSRAGWPGRSASLLIAAVLAGGMTLAASWWYRDTRHYVDERGWPVRKPCPPWSELVVVPGRAHADGSQPAPAASERYTIPPDVTHVFGGYWDVYRISFLSGGRIVGVPYPMYPNRFPGWSTGLGPARGKIMILRPGAEWAASNRPAAEAPGRHWERVRSARAIEWHPALKTAWEADGRDPAELDRLEVVVP
jgi:hypothetical protein